jgi:hypothetical protein
MRHARDMQIKHWDVIAQAEFGEVYTTSVTRIGEVHNKLGLEPSAATTSSCRASSARSKCPAGS